MLFQVRHCNRARPFDSLALARSAAKTLERFQQVSVTGSAEEPGSLQFEVTDLKDGSLEYVRGIGDFFVLGIRDIVKEYPNACSLLVQREIGQEK